MFFYNFKKKWAKWDKLLFILTLYTIMGVLVLPYFQYQINPDGIIYINIAKHYLSGNWAQVIDSYHSPLISWVLIPFLAFNSSPVFALYSAKLMSLIVGFFTIIGFWLLASRFELKGYLKTVLTFLMAILTIYFVFSVITPDLLLVCILIYYFYFIFNPKYCQGISNGIFCGILGAMAYFTKSFAFPFFLVHFSIFNAIYYFNDPSHRMNMLKNFSLGICVFFLISGGWIGLISDKEGKLTYGTAGEFNHDLVGPNSQGWVLPQLGGGFAHVKHWSPFDSWSNFKYQIGISYKNIIQILSFLLFFSYFSIIILIMYILMAIRPFRELLSCNKILFPILTILIFFAGYTPVLVEERYIWMVWVLLLLMGGYLLSRVFENDFFTRNRKTILILIFSISFILSPLIYLNDHKNSEKDIYQIKNSLNPQHFPAKSASNGILDKSLYLSYYLGAEYVGQAGSKGNYTGLENQLKDHNVDIYFLWDDKVNLSLENYTEINFGKLKGLKIYSKI